MDQGPCRQNHHQQRLTHWKIIRAQCPSYRPILRINCCQSEIHIFKHIYYSSFQLEKIRLKKRWRPLEGCRTHALVMIENHILGWIISSFSKYKVISFTKATFGSWKVLRKEKKFLRKISLIFGFTMENTKKKSNISKIYQKFIFFKIIWSLYNRGK